MKLTVSAHQELSRLLTTSRADGYDGFAVYWASESTVEAPQAEQTIWETREQTGWKLKLVPLAHLPPETIHEVSGIRFFLGGDRKDHKLHFEDETLWLDGEPVEFE